MRQEIQAALQALETRYGRLDARRVLEAARDPNNALHECFPWDLQTAAERYWMIVAGNLINDYKLTIRTQNTTMSIHAYMRTGEGEMLSTTYARDHLRETAPVAMQSLLTDIEQNAIGSLESIRNKMEYLNFSNAHMRQALESIGEALADCRQAADHIKQALRSSGRGRGTAGARPRRPRGGRGGAGATVNTATT